MSNVDESSLPAVPDDPDSALAASEQLLSQVAEWLPSADDPETVWDTKCKLDALEEYANLRQREAGPLRSAQRLCEARIGQLVPPTTLKRAGSSTARNISVEIPKNRLSEFRALDRYREVWEPKLPLTRKDALKLIGRWRRENEPSDYTEGDRKDDHVAPTTELRHGDFRERLADIPAGSVDLILTDPPYPKDDLYLYGEVAKFAAEKLGPRGRLAVYAGNIFLPQVLELMTAHVTYGWTYCYLMDNPGQSRIFGRHIMQAWKPVLVFSTGTWPSGEWHQDLIRGAAPAKDQYAWEQEEYPAAELIERLSPPGGLVVDPFSGVGTFGAAAVKTGRRFIGCELSADRYTKAVDRISS